MKHLLKLMDLTEKEISEILNTADQLKYEKKNKIEKKKIEDSEKVKDELKVKVHPDRFQDPEMISRATELFQLIHQNKGDYNRLIELKELAYKELHIIEDYEKSNGTKQA